MHLGSFDLCDGGPDADPRPPGRRVRAVPKRRARTDLFISSVRDAAEEA